MNFSPWSDSRWRAMVLLASKEYSEMRELDPKYLGVNSMGQTAKRAVIIQVSWMALEVLLKADSADGFRYTSDCPEDLQILGVDAFYRLPQPEGAFEVLAVSSEFEPVEAEIPLFTIKFTKEMIGERESGS